MELRILLAHPRMTPPPMSIPARRSTRILATCRPHGRRRQRAAPRRVADRSRRNRRCRFPRDAPPMSIPTRRSTRNLATRRPHTRDATPSTPRDAGLNFRAFLFNFNSNPHAARRTTPRRVTDSTLSTRGRCGSQTYLRVQEETLL